MRITPSPSGACVSVGHSSLSALEPIAHHRTHELSHLPSSSQLQTASAFSSIARQRQTAPTAAAVVPGFSRAKWSGSERERAELAANGEEADHIFAGISEAGIPRGRPSDIRDKETEHDGARTGEEKRLQFSRFIQNEAPTSGMRPTRKYNSGTISRSANRTSRGASLERRSL